MVRQFARHLRLALVTTFVLVAGCGSPSSSSSSSGSSVSRNSMDVRSSPAGYTASNCAVVDGVTR